MKKILLVGYMGSGKSVVGKLLAQQLNIAHYDLDDLLQNHFQMSISEIFEQKGEIYFRKMEHQIFKELISNTQIFVLSLGGGTPCYANNHLLFSEPNVISIYLNASINTLQNRLFSERKSRPLLAGLDNEEFKEYIAKHLFERSYFYNNATLKISVNSKTPTEIASEILEILT